VAALKRALHEVREARRGAAVERERAAFTAQWGGPDHREAMSAFATRK
jgi:enoyl-CoA hydratase